MISVKLLSLVLGRDDINLISIDEEFNELNYTVFADFIRGTKDYDLNLDTLGRLIKEKLRSMNYMTTIYIHIDTVAINLAQAGKKVYSTPSMTTYNELEALVEALDYVVNKRTPK